MKNNGQNFLEELASSPSDTFEKAFSAASNRLGLGTVWDRNELTLLCDAAEKAATCNRAINARGEFAGTGSEARRSHLEREFLVARDMLYASPGWQALALPRQEQIERTFLQVSVAEEQLAA